METGVPVDLKDYVKQIKRWNRGWHYAIRTHRRPRGLQWVDFVAGLMTLNMLLVLLVAAPAFGVQLTIFGHDAATVLPIHHVDRCHL